MASTSQVEGTSDEQPRRRHQPRGLRDNRGHLDHIAINAASKEAFDIIRKRLIDEGASDGTVTDFGAALSVFFADPDGMHAEVCVMKKDASFVDDEAPDA